MIAPTAAVKARRKSQIVSNLPSEVLNQSSIVRNKPYLIGRTDFLPILWLFPGRRLCQDQELSADGFRRFSFPLFHPSGKGHPPPALAFDRIVFFKRTIQAVDVTHRITVRLFIHHPNIQIAAQTIRAQTAPASSAHRAIALKLISERASRFRSTPWRFQRSGSNIECWLRPLA